MNYALQTTNIDHDKAQALNAFIAEREGKDIVVNIEHEYDEVYSYDGESYLVLTDYEADEAFKESVESFVDECVLDQIPDQYRPYFDYEAFVRDVRLSDGRGPTLASYDGEENEAQIGSVWYFIYRID